MTKKVLLIVFGAVAALLGLGLGIGGGALLAVAGGDRYLESGEESLATPTYALVSEASILDNGSGSDADGFSVTLRVTARSDDGAAVFVGVAPSAEVERYLAGVPYDELRNLEFSPFRYETDRHQGEQAPGPPTDGPRWTGQAVGTGDQTLEFDTRAGTDHQVVVMNADGSEGVAVTASFGLRVPFLSAVGTGLLIAGVVFLLLGLALLVWGLRTKVQPRAPTPAWGAYSGYGPPPPGGYGYGPPPGGPTPSAYGYPPGAGFPPAGWTPPPGWTAPPGSTPPPGWTAPPDWTTQPGRTPPGWTAPPGSTPPEAEPYGTPTRDTAGAADADPTAPWPTADPDPPRRDGD